MALEHGGLAMFLLVYIYVWFGHYAETMRIIDTNVDDWSPARLVLKLASCGIEIIGTGFVVFLIFVALIMTCFRALSFMSIGLRVDPFPLRLAFGWAFDRRLLATLVTSTMLSISLITLFIILCRTAKTPNTKPKRPVKANKLETYVYFPWRYIRYQVRRVFIPYVADSSKAHTSLVRSTILVNLLTTSMAIIMVYSNMSPNDVLPAAFAPQAHSFSMTDYANIIKKL